MKSRYMAHKFTMKEKWMRGYYLEYIPFVMLIAVFSIALFVESRYIR